MGYSIPRRPSGRPSATVVIPCYRYGHYLTDAVKAALAQRHVKTKVVIVDDYSLDGSADIARALADSDSRVTVIVHEENKGHIQTYNDGLALVDTDLVALVSADDLLAPGALDRAAALMQRHPSVGLVYGKAVTFTGVVPANARSVGLGLWRTINGRRWIWDIAKRGFNPIYSPEAVVRTDVMRQIGSYSANLPHSGDLEYWLRIASQWDIGQIRGCVQAYYRIHGANMHISKFGSSLDNIRQKIDAFRTLDAGGRSADAGTQPIFDRALSTFIGEALAGAIKHWDEGRMADAIALARFAVDQVRDPEQSSQAYKLLAALSEKEK